MTDAREAASKLFSKSRWRTKMGVDDGADSQPKNKPAQNFQLNDDVSDFLRPSTEKARQHKETAAAAFQAAANRPRIDVSRALRWPGAQEIINSAGAGGKSPGPGGLKTGTRKKGLTVSFVRTVPEIIGHGGDECEDPAIEVSKRKNAGSVADTAVPQPQELQQQQQQHLDDTHLGTRSNGIARTSSQTEQRNSLTRTYTSHGERSPPLEQKLQMGQINSYTAPQPPPPPPQRVGAMGLGERPRMLMRAATGFDQLDPSGQRRPSHDSAYSQDSDNLSPVLPRKTSVPSVPEQGAQQDDDFRPKPMKRTQTGFADTKAGDIQPPIPTAAVPRLPEMQFVSKEDDSPLDSKAMLAERYLQSEPTEPNSFAARVKQRMRADEGKALHEAAQRRASGVHQFDSDTESTHSQEPAQTEAPPTFVNPPSERRTPPQGTSIPTSSSPQKMLDSEDPLRSRARGMSTGRKPLPPGILPVAPADPLLSSSASGLPTSQQRLPPATSNQETTSTMEKPQVPRITPHSDVPAQPQSENGGTYYSPLHKAPPPPQNTPATATSPGDQLPLRSRPEAPSRAPLNRSDTKLLGEAAYHDFGERITHMKGIFQLTAQLGGQLYSYSPAQWIRVASWWFLKGRAGMETLIRSQLKSGNPQPERLAQPHVDLAKVWWILNEVLPNHPGLQKYANKELRTQAELAKQAGDAYSAEVFDVQGAIIHYMKLLVGSMKKHQSMPPTQALIQGQDQSIWEQYPAFALDAVSVLNSIQPKASTPQSAASFQLPSSQCIPLADTSSQFVYFRMFGTASLSTDDPDTDRAPMAIAISVLRSKESYQVKLAICSQTNLVNIFVGSNSESGPTWKDVHWKKQSRQISIELRHGFIITIELSEPDWRALWGIVDHTNRVERDLLERRDERLACQMYLQEAGYKDPANPSAFPPERVPGCKLMVFEKIDRSSEGTGKRVLHRGHRLVLVTAQQHKQVHIVNHEVGTKQEPMNFEYITESDQTPSMKLMFREETPDKKQRFCMVYLVFQESKDRNHLFGTLTSMNIEKGETTFAQVPLKAFSIESADQAEGFSQKGSRVLERLQWQEGKIINQDPEAAELEAAPTVMSESLRIVCRHSAGVISDRMNLGKSSGPDVTMGSQDVNGYTGPGELLVRLPIDGAAELTLLREVQQDLTIAIDGSRTGPEIRDALADLLMTLTTASTIRRLTFNSFKDLHAFQYAVTGFAVKFDGYVTL